MQLPENQFPDLVTREDDSIVYYGDQPLKTAMGNDFIHNNDRLLKHVITDLLLKPPDNNHIHSISILEYEIDYLGNDHDLLLENFSAIARPDPFYILKTGGAVRNTDHRHETSDPNDISINLTFWTVSSILKTLNSFISQNLHLADMAEDDEEPVLLLMKQLYLRASKGKKAAVFMLWSGHGSGLILPFMLVAELITPAEYAKGVVALYNSSQLPAIPSDEVIQKLKNAGINYKLQGSNNKLTYDDVYLDAVVVRDFLAINEKPEISGHKLEEWIRGGESAKVEFKSTFRWDLKQNKTNPAVERASLKTICGFLNSSGGTLLIGVRDDGSTEGIESDRFPNEDKFLLHLWTLIRTCLGRDVSPYISTYLEKRDEKSVCVVQCTPSNRPVFLRQPGFDEEFYIRLGPGSAALDISEALKFIGDRFRT